MPMLRAVPSIIRMAASTSLAFRSFILSSAISRTCLPVTVPTFTLFGVPEAVASPAAFLSRTAAGGVLRMKEKVRSRHSARRRVELLAEIDNVHLVLAKGRTYGRRRGRLTRRDLELDLGLDRFLRHLASAWLYRPPAASGRDLLSRQPDGIRPVRFRPVRYRPIPRQPGLR
jgi:hypothetical protein